MIQTKVLWTETAQFPKGWGIKEHAHEYFHLFYFLSGKGVFSIGKVNIDISKGTLIIVPPNTLHELQKVSDDMVTAYEIKFSIFDAYLSEQSGNIPLHMKGNEFIETIIAFIVEKGPSVIPHITQSLDYFLCTLLIFMIDHNEARQKEKPTSRIIDTSGFSDITIDIIVYIENNYMHQINLDMIADFVDYNRNYICTVFKKDTGITIVDYLNYVRIRSAAQNFSYSDIDISLVCARVGFSNISHFNRTFKKLVGMSPGNYRRMFPLDISGNIGISNPTVFDSQILDMTQAFNLLHRSEKDEPED